MSAELTDEQVEKLTKHEKIKNIRPVSKCGGAYVNSDWGYNETKVADRYYGRYSGNGVKVAIVDTGLRYHEDLPTAYEFVDYVNSQSSQYDDGWHGTFIAGIIAGQDNDVGFIGIAPDVQLYIAKVLDSDAMGYLDDVINGVDWAISKNVDIINFSISMPDSFTSEENQLIIDACRRAYNAGIIVVSCSGNGTLSDTWDWVAKSTVSCPAYDYSCVAVGSVDYNPRVRSYFSNYGTGLDLVAPGNDVNSTYYSGYGTGYGTSFATASVVGHLACLKEKYPSYSRSSLVSKLLSLCQYIGSSNEYGSGMVMAELDVLGTFPSNTYPTYDYRIDRGFHTISWPSVTNAENYVLYYPKTTESDLYKLFRNVECGTNTYYNNLLLEYGYTYKLQVGAFGMDGQSVETLIALATIAPKPPTLSMVSKTDNSITVQVDLVDGLAEGDIVYISPSGTQSSIETSPEGQVTFTGLTSGTQYSLYARSWVLGGDGVTQVFCLTNGATINITTNALAPETPSSAPIITSRGEGSLSLSWGVSTYATSYTLRYKRHDSEVYYTVPNISGTTYTLSGLEYGVTYDLSVKGDNSTGSSEYTIEYSGTTTAKSPGDLTNPATTNDTIDVRVADGMTGNWDYIRVYAYQNGIVPAYKDITYASYQSGTRIVTWTNLSAGLQYKFNARTYYTYNSVALDSVYWSNDLYVTTTSRPDNFSWTTPKVQGDPATNLTATEWNALCIRINEFRQYKGLSTISFTILSSGGFFYASNLNEARNAIYPMNSVGLFSTRLGISDVVDPNDADDLLASDLNALVSCLNAIE